MIMAFLVLALHGYGQHSLEQLTAEVKAFQVEQNEHYLDKKKSPLTNKERSEFEGHLFYPIDLSYAVEARVELIEGEDTVAMATSAGNTKYYKPYAKLYFTIDGKECELTAYQSFKLRETVEYSNYLLLPFRDLTSGETSYGGGRYLDLLIPKGNRVFLNFNLAYNPYCAYTAGYNCTIPPAENTMKIAIAAGLMAPVDH